jgi:hypothetical protein
MSVPRLRHSKSYPSRDAALKAACEELKKAHTKVKFIEGPDGTKISEDEVLEYCHRGL